MNPGLSEKPCRYRLWPALEKVAEMLHPAVNATDTPDPWGGPTFAIDSLRPEGRPAYRGGEKTRRIVQLIGASDELL